MESDIASMTKCPASAARAAQPLSASRLRIVSYFLRSTGIFLIASARASASETGVPFGLEDLSCLSPDFLAAGSGLSPGKRSSQTSGDFADAGAALAPFLPPI